MLKIFKTFFIYFISSLMFFEIAFSIRYFNDSNFYKENIVTPKDNLEKKFNSNYSILTDSIKKKIILIGDSYFDYPLVKGSYDEKFRIWSLKNQFDFINLSQSGTKVENHFSVISRIPDNINNVYVISYKPIDIFRDFSKEQKVNQMKKSTSQVFNILKSSYSFQFLKDILHQVFFQIRKQPFYPTSSRKSMINPGVENLNKLNNYLNYLNDKKGKVILVVNFPFNYKYDFNELNKWELYKFFKSVDNKLEILISPDIINLKESINWRNGHPNENSVNKIFDKITTKFENN